MFGVFGFWLIGFVIMIFPRVIARTEWYSRRLLEWQYWLTTLGMAVMFSDLLIAGLIQGYLWRDLAPWEDSLKASFPFWLLRTISGIAMIAGQGLFVYNVALTWAGRGSKERLQSPQTETGHGEWAPA
jgi:cytochrome c oxidase cbb3-type subunit 1